MRIGIIGAGRMGQALAMRCAVAGHQVLISNSRGPHTLAGVVAALEGNVRAGTVAQAVQFGEVVAIAIPLPAVLDLPAAPFTGRIVVDATNYYPEPDRRLRELDADLTTSSELLASTLPGAAVVKAFNTIYFRRLLDDSQPNLPATERLAIPVAGDDADAKRTVIDLIDQIGFTAVDTGTLAESRRQQPGSSLYQAFAKARAAGETLTAARARQLLAAAPEGRAVPDPPQELSTAGDEGPARARRWLRPRPCLLSRRWAVVASGHGGAGPMAALAMSTGLRGLFLFGGGDAVR